MIKGGNAYNTKPNCLELVFCRLCAQPIIGIIYHES